MGRIAAVVILVLAVTFLAALTRVMGVGIQRMNVVWWWNLKCRRSFGPYTSTIDTIVVPPPSVQTGVFPTGVAVVLLLALSGLAWVSGIHTLSAIGHGLFGTLAAIIGLGVIGGMFWAFAQQGNTAVTQARKATADKKRLEALSAVLEETSSSDEIYPLLLHWRALLAERTSLSRAADRLQEESPGSSKWFRRMEKYKTEIAACIADSETALASLNNAPRCLRRSVEQSMRRYSLHLSGAEKLLAKTNESMPQSEREAIPVVSRQWVSPKDGSEFWATYLRSEDEAVVLKKTNRSLVKIKINSLVNADRCYIDSLRGPDGTLPRGRS